MLEYLEKLVEERRWEEALAYAEQLVSQVEDDPTNLLRLNVAVLASRWELGEFYGAQTIGHLCAKMVKELGLWEYYGKVSLYLGLSFERLGQYEQALTSWLDYFNVPSDLTSDPILETMIRYNVGVAYVKMGQYEPAIPAFRQALSLATQCHDSRLAHGVRHALIEALIRQGTFSGLPELLAKSHHYVRHLEVSSGEYEPSRLWHFVIRSEFALASHRYKRAQLVATKGLQEVGSDHRLSVSLHMLLARIYRSQGRFDEAVEHALQARIDSIACRRYDLELQAADYMYQLISESQASN